MVEFGQVIQNFSVMYKICIMQGITSKLKLKIYLLCKYLFNVLLLKLELNALSSLSLLLQVDLSP